MPAGEALQLAARARQASQWQTVLQIGQQLVQQQPRYLEAWAAVFDACHEMGDYSLLERLATQCLQTNPRAADALVARATALRLLQRHAEAMPLLLKAVQLQPAAAGNWNHLGILQKEMGLLEEALRSFNRCIDLRADYCMAYWNRSDLLREPAEKDLQAMQRLLASEKLANVDKARLHYALARAYEFLGRDEDQFHHVDEGARCKRACTGYDHAAEMRQMTRIAEVFDTGLLTRSAPLEVSSASQAIPVFICGLPRSGTTLAEQILSSHSQVSAGDELLDLPLSVAELMRRIRCDKPFPEWATQLNESDWRAIGQRYLERTRALQETAFFTDKNLLNYKAIGVIHRALPRARIVYCTREPMDNLWGCYRQLFGEGLGFTYSQEELADTWVAADRLMRHWSEQLPDRIHRIRYEDLVADQERETRRLLEFVGLPWESACLEFHRNPRAVRTTSATQVRQPLNNARTGQWRKFADQLQPMRERLNAAG